MRWVHARVLVRTTELGQTVDLAAELRIVVLHGHVVATDFRHHAVALSEDNVAGVASRTSLDAGTHVRGFGTEERDGLALHVRTHERAVCVVVLEERNEGRCHRDDLLRRNVHEIDFRRSHVVDLVGRGVRLAAGTHAEARALRGTTHENLLVGEVAIGVEAGVGLGDDELFFGVGREIRDLVGDAAVDDLAVRRLDEAVVVDSGVRGEVADKADVRAFRGFNRAHTAVVAGVHVADFEACALTGQTTRTKCRQAALVGEARKRVDLVHELRQLRRSEELLDRGDHGTDVDEGLRRDGLDVLGGHALTHDTLHTAETDADLVLDQLADAADAAVGEVVLVVEAVTLGRVGQVEKVCARSKQLGRGEDLVADGGHFEVDVQQRADLFDLGAELAVQLVAADLGEVVALRVEERVLEVGPWPIRSTAAHPDGPSCRSR